MSFHGFNNLTEHGYKHQKLDRSKRLVDAKKGVTLNNIVSTWSTMRAHLKSSNAGKAGLGLQLAEYLWRKKHSQDTIFFDFLAAIAKVYPGPQPTD